MAGSNAGMNGDITSVTTLFVYGTLMRGEANHARFCADALTIEPAVTIGRLYHLPMGFPAMIEADDGQVFGEAMTFVDLCAKLRTLDVLEGYRPDRPEQSMYLRRRCIISIIEADPLVPAFCYVWQGSLPTRSRLLNRGMWA